MATVLRGERKGRSGRLSYSGGKVVYEETRSYVVISDALNEPSLTVLSTSGLPVVMITTISGTSGQCVCTNLNPIQSDQDPHVWIVEATFSTDVEGQETSDNPDPTTWVPVYQGKFDFFQEPLYKDFSDPPKPYLNSAGDKFPEPLIYRRPILVYEFYQIEVSTITDIEIGQRNDRINSEIFRDWPARTLKVQVMGFERGFFYGYNAVKIDYQVAYNEEEWLNRPLDVGYAYKTSAGGARVSSDAVVWLNSDGTKKADSATEPDALEFMGYKEIDFNDFLR